jgi:hypothetical protein
MKNTVFRFLLAAMITTLLASCVFQSQAVVKFDVDRSLTANRSATVTFFCDYKNGWFDPIKEWNGKDIEDALDKANTSKWAPRTTILTVPAGDNSFTFDLVYTLDSFLIPKSSKYTAYNIVLNYNLQPGKEYQISGEVRSLGLGQGNEFFVGIYDVTNGKTLLKEWKLGENK